jgi:UDP-N-acetylmuramyl pentapeptide phosphotransferase/UDP-N-acetylglucosamine-1-phosphate transferase
MSVGTAMLGVATANRWLLTFVLAILAVLAVGSLARRAARVATARHRRRGANRTRGVRRRAGVALALGPVIGFVISPTLGEDALLITAGAVALAVFGVRVDRRADADRLTVGAVAVAAAIAVLAGVRLSPTGVGVLDALGAFAFILLVTAVVNGLGQIDGLVPGVGAAGAFGVFALAGLAGQDSLAGVAAGLGAACFAFLAFNLRPASLFVGRGGRLAVGYVLAVGALAVHLPAGPTTRLLVPIILLGVLVLDGVVVVADRLRRRRSFLAARRDHVPHRLLALGWPSDWAVTVLVVASFALAVVAVFAGRHVMSVWLAAAIAAVILGVVAGEAARGQLEREPPRGLSHRARVVAGVVGAGLVLGILPSVAAVPNVRSVMEQGRSAAARALAAARAGDDIGASVGFRQAAAAFDRAYNKLHSVTLLGGLLIPGLAPNLRAARTLSTLGRDLADAGVQVTSVVDPDTLHVVNGRLPLEAVQTVAPALRAGAATLTNALAKLRSLNDPYLIPAISGTLSKLETDLAKTTGDAQRAAAAAELAPAIFGAHGTRRYLLVVQNNAELRATGGLIGDWGVMTAVDGKVSISPLQRTAVWNNALASIAHPTINASADYLRRYGRQDPQHTLQSINLSPDFPAVGRALVSLAPQAGLGHMDGVLAVDPLGLAALLQLTGPVTVAGWPVNIDAGNIVNTTLSVAYAQFGATPARQDFLGDVAKLVVDTATSSDLGAPAQIARVLGQAAHQGHILLAFARPAEQQLAAQLKVAGGLPLVRSDSLLVNDQNAAGNKIDYYLVRHVDYRVSVHPDPGGATARVNATLTITLNNTAPANGLPQIVIGPYAPGYIAGDNKTWVSVDSPLGVNRLTLDGQPITFTADPEAGRGAYSQFIDVPALTTRTLQFQLAGRERLEPGGWYALDLTHQPTINPDRVQVSVDVPSGWQVGTAPGLTKPFNQRAAGVVILDRNRQLRVQVIKQPPTLDVWGRLQAGR